MSKHELLRNQQVHVTQRVKSFDTSNVFCKIKFISNHTMLQQEMILVMDHEKVQQHQWCVQFQLVYESVFNESLNAKRSTFETAGRKIVVENNAPIQGGEQGIVHHGRAVQAQTGRNWGWEGRFLLVLWNLLGLCGWILPVGVLETNVNWFQKQQWRVATRQSCSQKATRHSLY